MVPFTMIGVLRREEYCEEVAPRRGTTEGLKISVTTDRLLYCLSFSVVDAMALMTTSISAILAHSRRTTNILAGDMRLDEGQQLREGLKGVSGNHRLAQTTNYGSFTLHGKL